MLYCFSISLFQLPALPGLSLPFFKPLAQIIIKTETKASVPFVLSELPRG
jgi:hypothetical protein